MTTSTDNRAVESLEDVVIRFAGDSGDGMQLTGKQFTDTSALLGNDLATFPDYPSEIRAPAGTLYGVSGFQLRFASRDIHSPGDLPDVLVAMNPAAFKVNIGDLKKGGLLIVNIGNFTDKELAKAKYESTPLNDPNLHEEYVFVPVDLNQHTLDATAESGVSKKDGLRCKNLLALGMLYWIYSRPSSNTENWLKGKFGEKPDVLAANLAALKAGSVIAENLEVFQAGRYEVAKASLPKGTYRNIMGNAATAMGLVAAAHLSGKKLYLGSYPITPATDILHALAKYKNHDVVTFQAEDEIAGICTAIGASFAGKLAVTTTSGPGLALKVEAMGLAVMAELPLVIVDVQRGGPSTGMPTKTEQSDLLFAIFGRNGEAPIPVIAAKSPADCFHAAVEASRMAMTYMTPVILLTDGYLGNGAEPFKVPDVSELEPFPVMNPTADDAEGFQPYYHDERGVRPWAVPGTAGLEHRVGGLEKLDGSGVVSGDADNHQHMVLLRERKVMDIADSYAPLEIDGNDSGKVLVLGWGSTYGAIHGAVGRLQRDGKDVSQLHLRNVWPLPKELGDVIDRFDTVVIPEMNRGHLSRIVRMEFLKEVDSFSKVTGKPFTVSEIMARVEGHLA